ncbi:hypothetical protein FACS189499_07680 [Clostridia bacterium]|nr:hypothetical protein FACS189499_07680 [Clostridia bacterium]
MEERIIELEKRLDKAEKNHKWLEYTLCFSAFIVAIFVMLLLTCIENALPENTFPFDTAVFGGSVFIILCIIIGVLSEVRRLDVKKIIGRMGEENRKLNVAFSNLEFILFAGFVINYYFTIFSASDEIISSYDTFSVEKYRFSAVFARIALLLCVFVIGIILKVVAQKIAFKRETKFTANYLNFFSIITLPILAALIFGIYYIPNLLVQFILFSVISCVIFVLIGLSIGFRKRIWKAASEPETSEVNVENA